jgi:hypothetical protein
MVDDDDQNAGDDEKVWRWEISPRPYDSSNFDTYVTDEDDAAFSAIKACGVSLWDQIADGEELSIVVKRNGP